jgi:5-hydroxyisourate hydrolase
VTTISTHVLDTARGRPANGVPVRVESESGSVVAQAVTDSDGRVGVLGADLPAGVYRLVFDTAFYFASSGQVGFYPEVVVTAELAEPAGHYHVPLLLSPFAYSTYRGS